MVNYNDQQLNQIFSALSDSTRRAMLLRLTDEAMSVADLSKPFKISKPAITKHLKVLEKSGLLSRTIEGRVHRCKLEPEPLAVVSEWVSFYEKFWNTRLDALNTYFTEEGKKKK
ncbi:MAG: metalloregulator ArsR/SmtB family transcription factor [Pseudomonadales bacterium]|nr:metalloregulator ArsR/SmtB family transcription factor [Pseudomonadales bacterium]